VDSGIAAWGSSSPRTVTDVQYQTVHHNLYVQSTWTQVKARVKVSAAPAFRKYPLHALFAPRCHGESTSRPTSACIRLLDSAVHTRIHLENSTQFCPFGVGLDSPDLQYKMGDS